MSEPHAARVARAAAAAAVAAIVVSLAPGCAPALAPPPLVTTPRHPDFVFPAAPPELAAGRKLVERQHRAWQYLQAGDSRGARREFVAALRENAGFYPADAGLGYASLADRDYVDAIGRFDRVVRRAPKYVPALVGLGDALAGAGRLDEAVDRFEAALAVDASMRDVRRRLEVLALRGQQAALAAARRAAEAGRYEEAARAYDRAVAASPDSAFLYRELAGVERRQGKTAEALEHLRRAIALDPADPRNHALVGELLEGDGDYAGAAAAYEAAQAIEPGPEVAASLARVRGLVDLSLLPEPYRAIPDAQQITRGDLAALLGIRLAGTLASAGQGNTVVVTDVRGHWASRWVMSVIRAGVMAPFPNHTFQPRAPIRRLELAQAAARVLSLVGSERPALAREWAGVRPRIADLPAAHLGYPAAATVVAAGVLPLVDGQFRPNRPVSGSEAIEAVARLERLAR